MGPSSKRLARRGRLPGAVAALLAGTAVLVGPARPAAAGPGCTRVIGQATAPPAQLARWFATTGHQAKLDVSVLDLATMFVEEGAREGVRGDIAFAQSIVETGYFGFSPSVPPQRHNYAGIGATGGGVAGAGFPDARSGVRAQVQHLRAYADPSLRSAADLKAPLVDPRFGYLVPNPSPVPCWEQFGNGIWAEDPTGYGPRVLSVHQRIAATPVPTPTTVLPPVTAPPAPAPPVAAPVPQAADELVAAEPAPPVFLEVPTPTGAPSRPAAASQGTGLAAAVAVAFSGVALLSLCATLWWHGRRFASSAA